MKYLNIFTFLIIVLLAGVSSAACYTPAEAEAEQGIRIHSELMVIGLNCQHVSGLNGGNLYGNYRKFTANQAPTLSAYENRLIAFYRRTGSNNPVGQLNDFRTAIANGVSQTVARMRPDIFCHEYAGRLNNITGMSADMFRRWAASAYGDYPGSYPLCKG